MSIAGNPQGSVLGAMLLVTFRERKVTRRAGTKPCNANRNQYTKSMNKLRHSHLTNQLSNKPVRSNTLSLSLVIEDQSMTHDIKCHGLYVFRANVITAS
jgi:hypothetical protein